MIQLTRTNFSNLILAGITLLLAKACLVRAEAANKVFQWQFANNDLSQSLATCLSYPIAVKPYNATSSTSQGVPPYYMMALAIGGTPIMTNIGSDNNSLNWQPTHPPNTQLMLFVVDSEGSSGGVDPIVYNVIVGQSTQCVVNDTSRDFTVTSNVTGSLNTCQPWGLTVKGGIPPYNVTFAALDSPVVTNVTMPHGDDVFTYIDRADPGTSLIAAVSDLSGRWAYGTPLVNTKGSTDYDCIGLVSSSGNSTAMKEQQDADAAAHSKSKRRTEIIVGVCGALALLIVIAITAVFLFIRAEKRRGAKTLDERDKPWEIEETRDHHILTPFVLPSPSHRRHEYHGGEYEAFLPSSQSSTGASPGTASEGDTYSNDWNSNATVFPTMPGRRAKRTPSIGTNQSRPISSTESSSARISQTLSAQTALMEEAEPDDIIIQHRDAGGVVVREVPPPYADRNIPRSPDRPSSSSKQPRIGRIRS